MLIFNSEVVVGGNALVASNTVFAYSPVLLHLDKAFSQQYAFTSRVDSHPASIDILELDRVHRQVIGIAFPRDLDGTFNKYANHTATYTYSQIIHYHLDAQTNCTRKVFVHEIMYK